MDPVTNPYAPGAGAPPPDLAGRDDLRETVRIAIERVRRGLSTKSLLMVGLRGVGKTVLLDRMRDDAEAAGIQTVRIEAPEGRSLPALRRNLDEMNGVVAATAGALKDMDDGKNGGIQSPIFAHRDFERLEAEGEARAGKAIRQARGEISRRLRKGAAS